MAGLTQPSRECGLVWLVGAPSFEHGAGVGGAIEQGLVEQFVAQASDERLSKGVVYRLARRDVVQGNLMIVSPSQDDSVN
jgi:hypothetical protein